MKVITDSGIKLKYCGSIFCKIRGLMFRIFKKNILFDFFRDRDISLHSFFVFYSFDAVFLDNTRKVVHIKKNFKPFSFFTCPKKARYVLELKKGLSDEFSVGDVVKFK